MKHLVGCVVKPVHVKLCDWLSDFLSGGKIVVMVDGFSFSFYNINAGVPQGSHYKSNAQVERRRLATAAALSKDLEAVRNLLTLDKVQIRPSLKYCSHIWGAAAPYYPVYTRCSPEKGNSTHR
nr:unnamed protein product [Callosobruchus chinensis]